MSFILDALKKSEIERQRQTVPGLMDARGTPRRSRLPAWAWVLGALLGINLLVLAYVLTRSGGLPAKSAATQHRADGRVRPDAPLEPATQDSRSPEAPPAAAFSPLDAAPVYAPEIPVQASMPPAAAPSSAATAPVPHAALSGFGTAPPRVTHRPDPVLDADSKSDDEVLPTISELNLTGAQALPEIHLDVHVYATKPADRFVFVNMRKYHEGSTLQEGPKIERIRRDGVILSYQGLRFLLPRQSS